MKKNLMSLAVAASVAGVAASTQAAMYLNPEGTGQVLLYPYFNAENSNETSIHIVNTQANTKAVKVRILEYINSQEVLDFNLYLSPYDHFSFTIFQNPNGGGGALVTRDNSCTVPQLGTAIDSGDATLDGYVTEDGAKIQPFLPFQYQNQKDVLNFIGRTMTGHVEVIEMGVLDDQTTTFTPEAWALHDTDGVPASCAKLIAAWSPTDGTWGKTGGTPDAAITAPTGGLYGLSNQLNSTDAAAYGIEAAAIEEFWDVDTSKTPDAGDHTKPGSLLPSLGSGDKDSIVPNNGVAYSLTSTDSWDAVSSLFMQDWVYNDVMVNPLVGGMTDWVITFPTKREYVNGTTARAPFAEIYALKAATKYAVAGLACEDVTIKQWNREESTPAGGSPVFSPQPITTVKKNEICLETNTIAVGSDTSALGVSMQATGTEYYPGKSLSFITGETEGWMRMGFQETSQTYDVTSSSGNGLGIDGLPAMGFAAYKYVNGDRTYGFVSDHKGMVSGSALQ